MVASCNGAADGSIPITAVVLPAAMSEGKEALSRKERGGWTVKDAVEGVK